MVAVTRIERVTTETVTVRIGRGVLMAYGGIIRNQR